MATVNGSGQGLLSLNVRHLMAWVRWALGRQHLRMIHLIGMDGSLGADVASPVCDPRRAGERGEHGGPPVSACGSICVRESRREE